MANAPDVEEVVRRLLSGASAAEQRALLDGLLSGRVSSLVERLRADPAPSLGRFLWRRAGLRFASSCEVRSRVAAAGVAW